MRYRALVGPALGLALLACDSTLGPSPNATPVPTMTATTPLATARPSAPEPSAPSCTDRGSTATLVAFADKGDLWLYDATVDERRQLTSDREARIEYAPAFIADACLVYASTAPATIELLDMAVEDARRTIVEAAGAIASLDVQPAGGSIAYLQIDYDADATFRLERVDLDGGGPVLLHTFLPNPGRGAGSEDEVSVAWSPGGEAILVANTNEYSRELPTGAIYLFGPAGEVRGTWTGTHPRWSPDGRTIYYRGYAGTDGQRWRALDVAVMTSTPLGMRPGTNNLVVSPDGRRVAYDTSYYGDFPTETRISGEAPDVYVFDLTTGEEMLLTRGALGPSWISASDLIVTNAVGPTEASMNSWESLGTVTKISIGGKRTVMDMTSTGFDAAVHLGR